MDEEDSNARRAAMNKAVDSLLTALREIKHFLPLAACEIMEKKTFGVRIAIATVHGGRNGGAITRVCSNKGAISEGVE